MTLISYKNKSKQYQKIKLFFIIIKIILRWSNFTGMRNLFIRNNKYYTNLVQRSGIVIMILMMIFTFYVDFRSYKTYSNVLISQEETQLL